MAQSRLSSVAAALTAAIVAGIAGYDLGVRRAGTRPTAAAAVGKLGGRPPTTMSPSASGVIQNAAAGGQMPDWDARWRRLLGAARTPRTEAARAELLTELAIHDHERAMRLAEAEPNWKLRAELRNAVLQGWARTSPREAARYALALREDERSAAFAAVLAGAAPQPATAIAVADDACDSDPARAYDYSQALIRALGDRGEFTAAVRFLSGRPNSPQRSEEMDNAFSLWAENQPAHARAGVETIADPELRAAAFRGMVVGWSHADPAGLANFALQLPSSPSRSLALANAVPRWVELDPLAAASWLAQRDPSPDFDPGVAAVANSPAIVADRPDLAMSLAQGITEPNLRTTTLEGLARQWAKVDRDAVTRYIESSSDFSPSERTDLLAQLNRPAG